MARKKAATKKTAKKTTKRKRTRRAAVPGAWTAKEINFLKKNYKSKTAPEIGKALGRTVNAVRAKATALGLKKGVARRKAAGKKVMKKTTAAKKTTARKKPARRRTARKKK